MMAKMNVTNEQQANRMPADQEELADRIARALPRDGTIEPQPGVHFRRHSRPTERGYASTIKIVGDESSATFLGSF